MLEGVIFICIAVILSAISIYLLWREQKVKKIGEEIKVLRGRMVIDICAVIFFTVLTIYYNQMFIWIFVAVYFYFICSDVLKMRNYKEDQNWRKNNRR